MARWRLSVNCMKTFISQRPICYIMVTDRAAHIQAVKDNCKGIVASARSALEILAAEKKNNPQLAEESKRMFEGIIINSNTVSGALSHEPDTTKLMAFCDLILEDTKYLRKNVVKVSLNLAPLVDKITILARLVRTGLAGLPRHWF